MRLDELTKEVNTDRKQKKTRDAGTASTGEQTSAPGSYGRWSEIKQNPGALTKKAGEEEGETSRVQPMAESCNLSTNASPVHVTKWKGLVTSERAGQVESWR